MRGTHVVGESLIVGSFEISLGRYRLTPAMAAGVVDRLWKIENLYDRVTG